LLSSWSRRPRRQTLAVLSLEGADAEGWKPGSPTTFLGGDFLKASPRFSPDGRWLSYSANDSGQWEIYVQPFPGPGSRVQISSDGGNLALWAPLKQELYYAGTVKQQMMVVSYKVVNGTFVPERAQPWSPVRFSLSPPISAFGPGFALHPDGRRFAVSPAVAASAPPQTQPGQLGFVFNFFDELRRLAPP